MAALSTTLAVGLFAAGAGVRLANRANRRTGAPPELPTAPAPTDVTRQLVTEQQQAAKSRNRRLNSLDQPRVRSTLLTGPRGIIGDTPVQRKTLLGS